MRAVASLQHCVPDTEHSLGWIFSFTVSHCGVLFSRVEKARRGAGTFGVYAGSFFLTGAFGFPVPVRLNHSSSSPW